MDPPHPNSNSKPKGSESSDPNSRSNAFVTFKQFKSFRSFWEAQCLEQASLTRELLIEVGALKQWTAALDPSFSKQSAFLHDSDAKLKLFEAPDIRTLLKKIRSLLEETGILMRGDDDSASSSSTPKFNPELKKIYQSYVKPSVSFENMGRWEDKTVSSCHFGPLESPRSTTSVIFPEKSKSDSNMSSAAAPKTQKSQTNATLANEPTQSCSRFKSVPISDQALAEMVKLIKLLLASAETKLPSEPSRPTEIELPPSVCTERKGGENGCPTPSARAATGSKRSFDVAGAGVEQELFNVGKMDCILAELSDLKGRIEGLSNAKIAKENDGEEESA